MVSLQPHSHCKEDDAGPIVSYLCYEEYEAATVSEAFSRLMLNKSTPCGKIAKAFSFSTEGTSEGQARVPAILDDIAVFKTRQVLRSGRDLLVPENDHTLGHS